MVPEDARILFDTYSSYGWHPQIETYENYYRDQEEGRRLVFISDVVFLAVGVHSGYGTAQRIYVKRGYIPDGNGVWYQGKVLEQYAPCVNDDDLLLFFSKNLRE